MMERRAAPDASAVHGNAMLVGEAGLLVLGASGAGKSSLCLALLSAATIAGHFAALIADDCTWLSRRGDRLIARATHDFAGFIERRGEGVIRASHEPAATIDLVIDLGAPGLSMPRAPDESEQVFEHDGVVVPKFFVDPKAGAADAALAIFHRLVRDTKLDTGGIANFA